VGVGWSYHLLRSLPAAVGCPLFLAGLIGFVPMATRQPRAAAIVGAFCAAEYVSLGPGHTVFFRYVLPVVPFLCVSAAFAARSIVFAPRLAALLLAAPALVTSVWSDVALAQTDTRVIAAAWLSDHVKPNESIYQSGSNYSDTPLASLLPQQWPRAIFDAGSGTFAYAPNHALPDWLVMAQSPIGLYTPTPTSLQRVAVQHYSLVHRVRATRPDMTDPGVYDLDDAFFLPVSGFSATIRPGPTILIYRKIAS